mgnify:CR=1 FL=1
MIRCETCRYSFKDLSTNPPGCYCEYILKTGLPRECPIEDCDKYMDRKKKGNDELWRYINMRRIKK